MVNRIKGAGSQRVLGGALLILALTWPAVATAQEPADPLPPVIADISPAAGPDAGGTAVTIVGTGFTDWEGASLVEAVTFGGTAARITPVSTLHVVSPNELKVVAPAGHGVVDVTVITRGGVSDPTAADFFTYGSSASSQLAAPPLLAAPVAHPVPLTVRLSGGATADPSTGTCPFDVVQGQPMAGLMCTLNAFLPAAGFWNPDTHTVTVHAGRDRLRLVVGTRMATVATASGSQTAIALGAPAVLEPPGVTFVPLSFMAKLLGGRVTWKAGADTALVSAPSFDPGRLQGEALLSLLPVYPGATASHLPFFGTPEDLPVLGDPRDMSEEWLASAPEATVQRWATGVVPSYTTGEWTTETGSDGSTTSWIVVQFPPPQSPELEIALEPLPDGSTLMRYDAITLDLPPAPPSGPLPGGARLVTVAVTSDASGDPPVSRMITDPSTIALLTFAIDTFPPEHHNHKGGGAGIEEGCFGTGRVLRPWSVSYRFVYGTVQPHTVALRQSFPDINDACPGRISMDLLVESRTGSHPALDDYERFVAWTTGVGVRWIHTILLHGTP